MPDAPMALEAMSDAATAKAILARIRKGELQDGFAARDIRRREWSGLTDTGQIKAWARIARRLRLACPKDRRNRWPSPY